MRKAELNDYTDRALLVLSREAQRAKDAAERVNLVVRAVAIRRGVVREEPRRVRDEYSQC